MGNFGSPYPSAPGLSRPPAVPIKGARPRYTTWHLMLYDVTNPDDEGYEFAIVTDEVTAISRVRGRAKTMEREGFERISVNGDRAFMLVRPKGAYPSGSVTTPPSEVYLVTMMSCTCRQR